MSYDYVDRTERVDGLIVQIIADTSGCGDPRDADNLGIMLCWHPDYALGDEQFKNANGRGAIARGKSPTYVGEGDTLVDVAKYLRRHRRARHIIPLYLYDHSGISISAGAQLGRSIGPVSGRGVNPWDSAGWDTSAVGFIFTTKERMSLFGVEEKMVEVERDIPFIRGAIKGRMNNVEAQLRAEVKEYNDYLTGNVWGYVITKPHDAPEHEGDTDEAIIDCPHSETIDSCWGFVGDPSYCWSEAKVTAEAMSAQASA